MAQPYEFRGNAHRKLTELNTWTKQRTEAPLDPDLPILDPHHHLWDDQRGRYLIDELAEDTSTGHNIVGYGAAGISTCAISRHRRKSWPPSGAPMSKPASKRSDPGVA
jgi:hypothetical protein